LSELRRRLAEAHVDAFIRGRLVHEVWDARQRREWERRYFYQYRWSLPRVNFGDWVPTGWRQRISKWRHRFYFALGGMQPRFAVYAMPDGFGQPSRLGLRPRSTPFGPDFPCWIVDSWYALSRKAMEHVVEFVRAHPEVAHYYEHTVIPVESATGTIVFNAPELKVANCSLHSTRWSDPSSGRPDTMCPQDLNFLRSVDGIFARKFDAGSAELMDELDRIVL
jgi:hypothetical protein